MAANTDIFNMIGLGAGGGGAQLMNASGTQSISIGPSGFLTLTIDGLGFRPIAIFISSERKNQAGYYTKSVIFAYEDIPWIAKTVGGTGPGSDIGKNYVTITDDGFEVRQVDSITSVTGGNATWYVIGVKI